MFGLTQTATLYSYMGQHGGQPTFAEEGVEFRCRSEPASQWNASGKSVEQGASIRVFAMPDANVHTGDRIVLDDGSSVLVSEVQKLRGFSAVHHLEILARPEG